MADALDSDVPFDHTVPPKLTHIEQLESMAAFLLLFLKNMPDGVITEPLWKQVDDGMIKNDKERTHPSHEEQRTWIQETLSHSPAHSISFVLLTAMLDRVTNEVASTSKDNSQDKPPPPPEAPVSLHPGALVRRLTFNREAVVTRRQTVIRTFASTFAPTMIRSPIPAREKDKAALEDRKLRVVELFLTKDE